MKGLTKLGDLYIDDEKAAALFEWLDTLVNQRRRRLALAEEERARESRDEEWYNKLQSLAREWARKNGVMEGMPAYAMAEATWQVFTSSEGWFSPLDVHEYFQPEGDEWQEAWENAYVDEVETMLRAKRTKV